MPSESSNIMKGLQFFGQVAAHTTKQIGATRFNQAKIELDKNHFDFFTSLESDTNPEGYEQRMTDELHSAYDELLSNTINPYAKQNLSLYIQGQKEADRQRMVKLQGQNTLLFGQQSLVTSLDDILAQDITPGDDLVQFREGQISEINQLIAMNLSQGIIDPDKAAQLNREYTQQFYFDYSKNMAYEAARTLMVGGKTPAVDALDLIEQVIRSGGGDLKEILGDGITVDPEATYKPGLRVVSQDAMNRLALLAQAYEEVPLTPEIEDKLISNLRGEARALEARIKEQKEQQAEVDDVELSKTWMNIETRHLIAENDFAMLDDIYGDDYDAKQKWIKDYGTWQEKVAETERKNKVIEDERVLLQGYDQEIVAVEDSMDEGDMREVRARLLADNSITDEKRTSRVSQLNALIERAENGETDKSAYYTMLADFDVQISDLGDAVRVSAGDEAAIKRLRAEIQRQPELIQNEQDRNERVAKLNGLLDDMLTKPDKNAAKVAAELAISILYNDPSKKPSDVRAEIRRREVAGEITGDDAFSWNNRMDKRTDVLGWAHVGETMKIIDTAFDSRMRSAGTDASETQALAIEQASAMASIDRMLEDPNFRAMSEGDQRDELNGIVKAALTPAVGRQVFGVTFGKEGGTRSVESYETAIDDGEMAVARSLFDEITRTWKKEYENEFKGEPWAAGITGAEVTDDLKGIYLVHSSGAKFSMDRKNIPIIGTPVGSAKWLVMFPGQSEWEWWSNSSERRMRRLVEE